MEVLPMNSDIIRSLVQ